MSYSVIFLPYISYSILAHPKVSYRCHIGTMYGAPSKHRVHLPLRLYLDKIYLQESLAVFQFLILAS